jgi:hypothetical protein
MMYENDRNEMMERLGSKSKQPDQIGADVFREE